MVIQVEAYRLLERMSDSAKKELAAKHLRKQVETIESVRFIGFNVDFNCRASFSALVAGYPYSFEVPCCPVSGTWKEVPIEGCEWVKYY